MLFEEWYRGFHATLFAALLVVAGDWDAAQDAADEALVRALERWDRVRRMHSPEGWTYTVGVNVLRRRARRSAAEPAFLEELPATEMQPEVWQAVHQLTRRQREAIAL